MDEDALPAIVPFSENLLQCHHVERLFTDCLPFALHVICVNRSALRGRQIIDAPPAHLEQDEGEDENPERRTHSARAGGAQVDVDEIGEPGDGSPRLLRVPRPVVAPRLLGLRPVSRVDST